MLVDLMVSRETLGVRRRCDVHRFAQLRCYLARVFKDFSA